jgi:hypothetical protein
MVFRKMWDVEEKKGVIREVLEGGAKCVNMEHAL